MYLENPCKSEICYFVNIVFTNKYISGCQITVDIILRFQVSHSAGHLSCHIHLMWQVDSGASIICTEKEINYCQRESLEQAG